MNSSNSFWLNEEKKRRKGVEQLFAITKSLGLYEKINKLCTLSGSGQSPNSWDAGYARAISAAPPPAGIGYKRPGYYLGADGLETKKRRISHFHKSETGGNNAVVENPSSSLSFSFSRRIDECQQKCTDNKERPASAQLPHHSSATNDSQKNASNNLTISNPESKKSSASSTPTNDYGPNRQPSITANTLEDSDDDPIYHP